MSQQLRASFTDQRECYYRDQIRPHGQRYREFHAPSVYVLLDLVYTYDVTSSYLGQRVGKFGLSLSAFNVLMILSRSKDGGRPLHEIGDLMLVSRANVTGLVDCLEERELVRRCVDSRDRRVRIARITPKGESLLKSLLPNHYSGVQRICSNLSTREKSELRRLLSKLRRTVLSRKEGTKL